MAKKGGLGKGMEALIGNQPKEETKNIVSEDVLKLAAEQAKKTSAKKSSTARKASVKKTKTEEPAEKKETKKAGVKTETKAESKKPAAKNTTKKAEPMKSTAKTTAEKPASKTTTKKTTTDKPATKKETTKKTTAEPQPAEQFLPINKVEPNRDQPRKVFDEDALNELAESIRIYGVLQPLLVQKEKDYYRIIAGERRWRAAKIAGLKKVPVIIKELSEKEILEISLIENLQREDLNPIEEAEGYQRLLQEFDMTQEDLAQRVSKSRSAITNTIRLLKLDEGVQKLLSDGALSSGHARALLSIEDNELQKEAAERIIREGLSVRDTERLVKRLTTKKPEKQPPLPAQDDFIYRDLEEKMRQILETKVQIKNKGKCGRIEIEYYSPDELDRIMAMLQTIR